MRVRRIVAIGAATLLLLGVGSISALGADSSLFGYTMGATGSAISFLYNQPSFGVPSDPTFELRKMYSLAELDSGPSSHGLGSLVWPGQVVGNAPPSLLFDTVLFNPTQLSQLQPVIDQIKTRGSNATAGRSGYPIRAEAFYPSTKADDSQDVGAGARMQASARQDIADASSTTGGAGIPGAITFGSVYSRSTSQVVKGLATAFSVTHITDLDMFGAIHIDSLLATATATSDGNVGKTEGTLELAGMTIKDQTGAEQFAISLDKTGLHVRYPNGKQDQDPVGQLTAAINKSLGPQGLSLSIGKPIDLISGPAASRSLAGLTLHLDAHGMNSLLDAIDKVDPTKVGGMPGIKATLRNPTSNHPVSDPIFGDKGVLNPTVAGLVASFFQGDQTLDFVFGGVAVSSAASPALPEFPITIPVQVPPVLSQPSFTGGNAGGGTTTTTTQQQQTGPQTLAIQPVGVVGIPFALLALVLAAGLIGSSRLRLFADSVIASRATARCPLEEQDT